MITHASDTTTGAAGPLHAALVRALPAFVKEPFSGTPRLNVPQLKDAIGMSHETVYKWLRTNRLNPRNARRLVDLANSEANVAVLKRLRRNAPKIEDFARFYLA